MRASRSRLSEGALRRREAGDLEHAIRWLEQHTDSDCARAGSQARQKFDAGQVRHDPSTRDYGYMTPGSSDIFLGRDAFDPGELATTVAHEVSHFWGYSDSRDGSATDAYAFGYRCAGPV